MSWLAIVPVKATRDALLLDSGIYLASISTMCGLSQVVHADLRTSMTIKTVAALPLRLTLASFTLTNSDLTRRCQAAWSRSALIFVSSTGGELMPTMVAGAGV